MIHLLEAIKNRDLQSIRALLEKEPSLIDTADLAGTLVPFLVAKSGDLDIMKYVVEYSRASMNIVDSAGKGILHYGVESGNENLVMYLVESVGMDPLVGDYSGVTAFENAHRKEVRCVVKYLESYIGCNYNNMYKNPIRTGAYPDPSVVRVADDFYMVNSSFTYFPCIPISHSRDLIHWKIIGHAITNPENANIEHLESGRGYWAPDISYFEERFYVTATYRMNDDGTNYRKQIIVSSENPEGPYTKPSIIHEDGIDPSIFNDEDGRRYMLLNRGARILELNRKATEQISKAILIWYGDQKRAPEGPHLLKKDGYYYLFVAEGGTGMGHRISVSRSKKLMGPYENCPYNPIMRQKDEHAFIQRAGHGKPVQTQFGQWYMVYLCGRRVDGKYSILGRETALDPITWTADGWPLVNQLKGPSVLQKKPALPECVYDRQSDFWIDRGGTNQGRTVSLNWMWVRVPDKKAFELIDEGIRIYGSEYPLYDIRAKNILVRRQEAFSFNMRVKMKPYCESKGQEAGVTCYYDENTYLTYAVAHLEQGYKLQVTEQIGGMHRISLSRSINEEEYAKFGNQGIILEICTNRLVRKFYYSDNEKGKSKQLLGTLENVHYLCDEGYHIGKRFTGAMFGIYVVSKMSGFGKNQGSQAYGEFTHMEIEEVK